MNTFEKAQIKLMKDYINYDKLVDELIESKDKEILKCEIQITSLREKQEGLRNDINRIKMERDHSNLGHNIAHIFINPHKIYYDMTTSNQ